MSLLERREHPRIETEFVTVEIYTSFLHTSATEVEEICSVINLSESGMRFRADCSFKNGQILRLTFLLPDSIVIIRTDAIVVHIEKSTSSGNEIGVQFKNLGLAENKLIEHFIKKILTKNTKKQD